MRGFKRSRALWDNVRSPTTTTNRLVSWLRAILYELQPIRFSQINSNNNNNNNLLLSWKLLTVTAIRNIAQGSYQLVTHTLPWLVSSLYHHTTKCITTKQWLILVAVVLYYYMIRWIHDVLQAGPFVIILTALMGIFTIGLGDTASDDGLSAYSVFNRGFEKLLGSIDADALLAQHVGGGGMGMVLPRMHGNDDDDVAPRNNNNHHHHHPDGPQERRRRQLQAAAAAPHHQNNDNENANELDNEQQQQQDTTNRARRSGKKARSRGNVRVEQRREMQRQRDAAIAMGFGGNEQEDMVAMQRLIEDQVAVGAADAADLENDE